MSGKDGQGEPEHKTERHARREAIRATWWPPVGSETEARRVARYGFWATVLNVALTGVFLFLLAREGRAGGLVATDALVWWAAADIAVFAAVGIGLWFFSRIAAVAGLALFVASKLYAWAVASGDVQVTALLIAALFAYFYVLSVRGTFALHRLRSGAPA